MKVSNLDQLIDKYIAGKATEHERLKLEAWLEVMKVKGKEDFIMMDHDEEEIYQRIMDAAYSPEEIAKYRPFPYRVRTFLRSPYLKIAASILLIAAIWWTVSNSSTGLTEKVVVADNNIEKVILDDGSIVWLHQDASLSYNVETFMSTRTISLTGQALFEVAKDATHPFAIKCGDVIVSVVGTSFNLNALADKIELEVLTGKVKVSSSLDDQSIMVLPNEKISFGPDGLIDKTPLVANEVASLTIDTEYDMAFSATEMFTVISRLENKFNVSFELDNAVMYNCRITANLTDHSLASSLMIISELIDFKYVVNGNKVSVTGNGCN